MKPNNAALKSARFKAKADWGQEKSGMSPRIAGGDRMAAVLADAMDLPEAERVELAQMLSRFVNCGLWLDSGSVRAGGNERVRTLFQAIA